MKKRGPKCVLAGVAAVLAWPGASAGDVAEDIFWVHEGNAPFHFPGAWDPPQVPGPADAAHFDLPDLDYVVNFTEDVTTRRLRVHDGRPMFELGGRTYSVTEDDEDLFSVVVGTTPSDFSRLILLNGTLESHRSLIGRDAGSNGVVRVEAGGVWDNSGSLTIGRHGNAELRIIQGGVVRSHRGVVGEHSGSDGRVVVSGAGSAWDLLLPPDGDIPWPQLGIGAEGNASMEVRDGGAVRAYQSGVGGSGGSGSLSISGEGTSFTIDLWGGLFISSGGSLLVEDDAKLEAGWLTVNDGGVATIRGPQTRVPLWSPNSQSLNVGVGSEVNIVDGARIGGVEAHIAGRLNIDGGVLGTIEWVSVHGGGELHLNTGGRIGSEGLLLHGFGGGEPGKVLMTGAETIWNVSPLPYGQDYAVRVGHWGPGQLVVADGAVMRTQGTFLLGTQPVDGSPQNEVVSQVLITGAGAQLDTGLSAIRIGGDLGPGEMRLENGATVRTTSLQINEGGAFHWSGGNLTFVDAPWGGLGLDGGELLLSAGGDKVISIHNLQIDTGRIDLADNRMIVHKGDLPQIHDWVKEGYAGGTWTGPGITSSVAAEDGQFALGVGPIEEGVLVKFTYGGDANLDGKVTIADLSILAVNWQQSDRFWYQGDFNYDSVVNISDLTILAGNWGKGTNGPAIGFEGAMAMFDAFGKLNASAFEGVAVPEPGVVGVVLGLGVMGMRRRIRG